MTSKERRIVYRHAHGEMTHASNYTQTTHTHTLSLSHIDAGYFMEPMSLLPITQNFYIFCDSISFLCRWNNLSLSFRMFQFNSCENDIMSLSLVDAKMKSWHFHSLPLSLSLCSLPKGRNFNNLFRSDLIFVLSLSLLLLLLLFHFVVLFRMCGYNFVFKIPKNDNSLASFKFSPF